MGNRSGSSRSKSRDSKYKYPENYPNNNLPTNKHPSGYNNQRLYSSQPNGYSQQSYSNGYGGHLITNTQAQYPINQTYQHINTNTNPKPNSNKILYVANYDFTGTATSGELSFIKGDRLEILDRYTYVISNQYIYLFIYSFFYFVVIMIGGKQKIYEQNKLVMFQQIIFQH